MGHGGVRGQVVHDELAEPLGIGGRHPDEVVRHPGQVEHHQHPGQRADRVGEVIDLISLVHSEAYGDQRL